MLSVTSIPAFNDNYIWLLKNDDNHCVVVDPGDAKPVLETLNNEGLTLNGVLVTHHHNDHVGGIRTLLEHFPGLSIYGPATDRFPMVNHPLKHGQSFTLFNSDFTVFHVPGHTLDHIAYYAEGMLFCGDTLFSAGCGRLFEGTPKQMHQSLTHLASLPDDTLVFCAHEYTLSNLKFALAVEPNNTALNEYVVEAKALREKNIPTLPSSIGKEKCINPFLRAHIDSIKAAVSQGATDSTDTETFAALRRWKDEF
ncbi:Hydroxyacylglutathione hydrolase [Grimontia indica]|uniref:Hydroxyacylglutathione hydrolase n=1 Tax=Grimontia indica TaxID=1056512 RepID=R1IS13_9GAMM|nr:hydroxyacylglutathione hydrolase [Grimontia indica]EOD80277.1 Hydroxyacylglutathione hydrolase [Grimontia indica]